MKIPTSKNGLRLSLREIATVAGISPYLLRDWVSKGLVTPAAPGGKGRGNTHRFSVQQSLGLAVACWMWNSPRGCRSEHLAQVVKGYEEWPFTQVERALRLRSVVFNAEALDDVLAGRGESVLYGSAETSRLFDTLAGLRDMLLNQTRAARDRIGSFGAYQGAASKK